MAWEKSLETPSEWKSGPHNWNNSMASHLYTQMQKALKETSYKPNYDEATLSLVQNKLEGALFDPEKSWDEYRFLLLWKTSKLVTLGCYYCRKMSTLNYATLEPRDGRRLHRFFDQHLGGGIWFLPMAPEPAGAPAAHLPHGLCVRLSFVFVDDIFFSWVFCCILVFLWGSFCFCPSAQHRII